MKEWLRNGWVMLSGKQTSIMSAAFVIGVAWGISALLGILRYRLIYARFLACCALDLDAYNAAFRLPDLVFQLVVMGALSAAFIPVFSRKLGVDREEAGKMASKFLTLLLLAFAVVAVAIYVLARPLSQLMASSFLPGQIDLMVKFTRWLLLAQMFFLVSNFLTGVIQSNQRFLLPALSPVVYNLGIIIGVIVLTPFWGMMGVVWGVLLGAFLHLFVQLPLVWKLGFRFTPNWDLYDKEVRKIFRLMLPRTAALAVGQVEATAVVVFGSALSAGSLSLFYLAQSLANLPINILGVTIGQAALPVLSQVAGRDEKEFSRLVLDAILQVFYLVLPAVVLLVVLRVPLVRIAFGAKSFPWEATLVTGRTLALLGGLVVAGAVIQILTRSYYALHDTRTPFYIGGVAVAISVVTAYLLVMEAGWGVLGLAVAMSLASVVQALALWIILRRKLKEENLGGWYWSLGKMGFAAAIMAGVGWGAMRLLDQYFLDTTRVLPLVGLTVVAVVMGGGIYLGLSWILGIRQLWGLVGLLRKAGKWRDVLGATGEMIEPTSAGGPDTRGQA